MRLTETERLILSNQYRILEQLYPDEAELFALHRKAVEGGFVSHYKPHMLLGEEVSEEVCREVLEILRMHRALKFSFQSLQDTGGIEESQIQFRGFDENMEPHQTAYTGYLFDDPDRFDKLKQSGGYNSDTPMLERYRRMLLQWQDSEDQKNLTKEDLARIVSA
jgi:hypothetical protein